MESNSFNKKIMCVWCGENEVELDDTCCSTDCENEVEAERSEGRGWHLLDY